MHGIDDCGFCLFPKRHITGILLDILFICGRMIYFRVKAKILIASGNGIMLNKLKFHLI